MIIDKDNYFIIIMDRLGETILNWISHNDNYFNIGKLIGKELNRLHQVSKIYKSIPLDNRKIQKIINSNKFTKLEIFEFLQNIGSQCITHGDCSISNITIKDNQIGFIDTEKVTMGIPEYEYYQLISSIKWLILDTSIANELINGFIEGYSSTEFNDILEYICKKYWNL